MIKKSIAPLLLLLMGLSTPSQATIILRLDLDAMINRSDVIVRAKVISSTSRWTKDRRYIVTDTQLSIVEGLQGSETRKTLTVRRLGGTVDGIGMKVSGTAVLPQGQDVVVFTENRGGHRFVVGMQQGLYQIVKNASGKPQVTRALAGLALQEKTVKGMRPALHAHPKNQPELLSSFLNRLRQRIAILKQGKPVK
jgi:hypothetical protein